MANKPRLSIIIPVRQTTKEHRDTDRLANCLASLVAQTGVAAGECEVIVSDTDSSPAFRKAHEAAAKAGKARYIYTQTRKPWNISRARNIGIRAARGEFVMVTDMDCVFSPSFVAVVLKHAAEETIVHCRINDLPAGYDGALDDWRRMNVASIMRPAWCYGGCQVVSRRWAEEVHGYDEKYVLWGAEDNDLMERAVAAGKRQVWIEREASYFHQYHDQGNRKADTEQLARNKARLKLTETRQLPIVRNPRRWGGQAAEPGPWDDVAVIVTTFMRDKSMFRTVKTIRKFYPTIDIILADNGHPTPEKSAFAESYDCQLVEVPFDSGVTVTRNAGVRALDKRRHAYVVIVEDDIGFTTATDFGAWRAVLDAEPEVGVAGGLLRLLTEHAGESEQHYEATLEISADDRTAYLRKIEAPEWKKTRSGVRYHFADIVLNVFMARRATLDAHPWDENIKSAPEHCDWFFGLKYRAPATVPRRVVYCPDVALVHFRDLAGFVDEDYKAYRQRPGAFRHFADKWGVDYYWNSWHPRWGMENPQRLLEYVEASTGGRRCVFTAVAKALDQLKLKWWLEAGTCLGAIREKDFIGHDPDIDVGVWTDDVPRTAEQITGLLRDAGFTLYHQWAHEGRITELSFTKAEVKVDVFFFYERDGLAWHGAFGPENDIGTGGYTRFLPHIFSLDLFRDLKTVEFAGLHVKVPNPPERYLVERYGTDWKTPNRDYKYWTDCRAVAPKFFTPEAATVYIGGVWDVFHHGHLNILERCRSLGHRLVVGVLTDEAAEAYKARPLIPEAERLRIVRALRVVDEAALQHHQDPTDDLAAAGLEPDYLVHGSDWDFVPGADYVRAHGGRTVFLPYTSGVSSTLLKLGGGSGTGKGGHVVRRPMAATGGIEYAVGIKTFMRERTLERTVAAFRARMTSPCRLYICDDSGKKSDRKLALYGDLRREGATIIERPFDTGLAAGRNAIVKAATEPYVLITDDDVALDDQAALDRMRAVLDARPDIGLVAALVSYEQGGPFASAGYARGLRLERIGRLLKRSPMAGTYEKAPMMDGTDTLYVVADQVPNCFLARRELFEDVRWDDRIKVEYEHADFFLQMMTGGKWKAAVAVEAGATHFRSEPDMEYERHRRAYSSAYFKQKWAVDNVINQF